MMDQSFSPFKSLNFICSIALGFSVHEFDDVKGAEVIEFRRNIFSFVSDIFQERDSRFAESQALYKFPPEIESSPELPQNLEEKLENGMIRYEVVFVVSNNLDFTNLND
jgi:phosphatidylinositol-4,5-bisphosphate 3-kinase